MGYKYWGDNEDKFVLDWITSKTQREEMLAYKKLAPKINIIINYILQRHFHILNKDDHKIETLNHVLVELKKVDPNTDHSLFGIVSVMVKHHLMNVIAFKSNATKVISEATNSDVDVFSDRVTETKLTYTNEFIDSSDLDAILSHLNKVRSELMSSIDNTVIIPNSTRNKEKFKSIASKNNRIMKYVKILDLSKEFIINNHDTDYSLSDLFEYLDNNSDECIVTISKRFEYIFGITYSYNNKDHDKIDTKLKQKGLDLFLDDDYVPTYDPNKINRHRRLVTKFNKT